mmetsp:Transcript_91089/g.253620  ORF Transcript_91089/g.253620 Transcript_91089/m.253620 type:complete len:286 (+) Transcript_91089:76-933(+)
MGDVEVAFLIDKVPDLQVTKAPPAGSAVVDLGQELARDDPAPTGPSGTSQVSADLPELAVCTLRRDRCELPGTSGVEASLPEELNREKSRTGYRVCPAASLPSVGSRVCVHVPGTAPGRVRQVLVVRVSDTGIAAIDAACFHANGPLGQGDIEDVAGRLCIVCPVHFYQIDLKTGEWIEEGIAPVRSQRTHRAWEEGGFVFVELDTNPPELPSDVYAEVDPHRFSDDSDESGGNRSPCGTSEDLACIAVRDVDDGLAGAHCYTAQGDNTYVCAGNGPCSEVEDVD